MQIRLATLTDAAKLAVLDAHVNANPWTLNRYETICGVVTEAASASAQVLVGEEGTAILGFIVLTQVLDEGSIDNLMVSTARRRQGFGRALVAAGIEQLRENGVVRCLLEVRESNAGARNLYENFGFQSDTVRKNYYRTPTGREDACLLSLRL